MSAPHEIFGSSWQTASELPQSQENEIGNALWHVLVESSQYSGVRQDMAFAETLSGVREEKIKKTIKKRDKQNNTEINNLFVFMRIKN
ncbi:MAG: hypothetical protein ABI643_03880 [Candidatus Doudnabacteria bacterium]